MTMQPATTKLALAAVLLLLAFSSAASAARPLVILHQPDMAQDSIPVHRILRSTTSASTLNLLVRIHLLVAALKRTR